MSTNPPKNDTPDKALVEAIENPSLAISRLNRDELGRKVRKAWVRWAEQQPNPKPSWLLPYDELSEPDKEVDRQIGVDLARIGASAWVADNRFRLAALSQPQHGGLVEADIALLGAKMVVEGKISNADGALADPDWIPNRSHIEGMKGALSYAIEEISKARAALANSPVVGEDARYGADHFDWAAPGDHQEDAWLIRFCDKDCRDAIFTGPDAEREAWEYYERYAPAFNLYVFRLARLKPIPTDTADRREAVARVLADRFVQRGKARIIGSDYETFDQMPWSLRKDFLADADALIAASLIAGPSEGYPPYTSAIGEAGQAYINRVSLNGDKVLGGNFYYAELWEAMNKAARLVPEPTL